MSRFLHWLSVEAPKGGVDELKAAAKLQAFRQEGGDLRDLSFDTISGAGPNGAIVHYRVSEETNRPLEMDQIYLVDSGGQYPDGTTDVTRTVIVGTPTAEMKDRFTRVLQGPYRGRPRALSRRARAARQLDSFARQFLWQAGLDYAHGTGHGVGSFLSVHEGPQRISPVGSAQAGGDEPLKAGMFLSNEPGYYKTGEYGIRVENLVLVVPVEIDGRGEEAARLRDAHLRADRPQPDRDGHAVAGRAAVGRRLSRAGAGDRRPAAGGRGEGLARGGLRAALAPSSRRRPGSTRPIGVRAFARHRLRPQPLDAVAAPAPCAASDSPAAPRRAARARSSSCLAMARALTQDGARGHRPAFPKGDSAAVAQW